MSGMVHIVDDEDAIRDALAFLLASRGLSARGWPSGEAFLAAQPLADCACVILDVRMGALSGPEVFERLRAAGNQVPVIFLTGHADVPVAVRTLKAGAFDFVEKPFSDNALVDRIEQALAKSEQAIRARLQRGGVRQRLAELTERERDVMRLVVDGRPNKLIADELGISVRTVEVHRARVFEKMEVRSAVELANLLREGGAA